MNIEKFKENLDYVKSTEIASNHFHSCIFLDGKPFAKQFNTISRNAAQFSKYLIASLFAIIAQSRVMKRCKIKQSFPVTVRNAAQRNPDLKPELTVRLYQLYVSNVK